MARIDIKGLTKRRDALRDAAMEVRKLYKRGRTKRPHPDEGYHLNKLETAAFEFVKACMMGFDGAHYNLRNKTDQHAIRLHLAFLREAPDAAAATFDLVMNEPYDHIFKLARDDAHSETPRRRGSPKK